MLSTKTLLRGLEASYYNREWNENNVNINCISQQHRDTSEASCKVQVREGLYIV